jgi:hypothetical protein
MKLSASLVSILSLTSFASIVSGAAVNLNGRDVDSVGVFKRQTNDPATVQKCATAVDEEGHYQGSFHQSCIHIVSNCHRS